ncbi:MAG: shikimate dehydrogenase [Gammaproteobacteria bacterium]|nr:shikimate dehydrogenase [Gammaproteobacteria bacterium]MDH5591756.1 shikimate dehydrogenase [Gammaproteobacteria bacterium]
MTDHYAVIGNPISHSKSPLIHSEFARQTGQNIDYIAREVPLDDLSDGLKKLQQKGFKGINITVPFKEQAWQVVNNKSAHAQRAGAINTLVFNEDGSLYGDNTDGIGLCRDLVENNGVKLKGKRLLLLGAGGAARGVIEPLLNYQPVELFIANRTARKAQELAKLFSAFGVIHGGGFDELTGKFDIIINATAASLQGEVPPLPNDILSQNACCYDMMYSNTDTAFITWAKQHGAAKSIDGLGMLVEQAAEAFRIWRGIKPETQSVIKLIRNQNSV